MQAPGVTVNSEGVVITPEGMAQIEQRHEGKQALLEGMRKDREAAYALKDSHIGVGLARDLGDLSLIAPTYNNLAAMANYCALAGRDNAGRTLASLANGLMRGAVQMFGPSIEQRIYDYEASLTEQARQDLGLSPKPTEPVDPDDDSQGSSRLADLKPLVIVDDRTPEQLAEDGDTHWPDGSPYVPPLLAGMTSQRLGDVDEDIAEQLRNYASAPLEADEQSSGDDREPLDVTEVAAVSPEPDDESPQHRAARLRREAKRLAQQGQAASETATLSAETSEN